jgi:hypothetical protein
VRTRGRQSPFGRARRATRKLRESVQQRGGGAFLRPLYPQVEFWQDLAKCKLLRCGNQLYGKTVAGVIEVDWHCTKTHPYVPPMRGPVRWVILTKSKRQSIPIQRKFFEHCTRGMLTEATVKKFSRARGFRGQHAYAEYTNGSIVYFVTTNQGAEAIMGDTLHGALIDEPTSARVFEEVRKRLTKTGGYLLLTLTPINGPTDYLRELCDEGMVSDHHFPLRPEWLIPQGDEQPLCLDDGTPQDQTWCEQHRRNTLPTDAPVVVDGEWETRSLGRTFIAFDQRAGGSHITDLLPRGDVSLVLGIDHGAKDFKQIALLVAVDLSGEHPKVHVLDEYVGEAMTTSEQDAEAILAMIRRTPGIEWADLDHATGDKPYDAARNAGRSSIGRKSNKELMAYILKTLQRQGKITRDAPLVPQIRQAKTGQGGGRGSIDRGCTWLHKAMVRAGHFTVHPRCKRLIEALSNWDYADNDWKDPIDALRYATWPYAMRGTARERGRGNATLYVY